VIGSNTTEAHPVAALRMKKAVRNGATLVVADPRKIWLTKIAKRHLQLTPGTDVWLLNALLHVIFAEGLEDTEYIARHTENVDELRAVVARYTPEEAERVTGVPADDIRATAREYAREPKAAIFYTLGITEHVTGVDNVWGLANLVLATGHLGHASTGLNAMRGQNNVQGAADSGANPLFLPGYQAVEVEANRQKFGEAWGADIPATPGYRLDEIVGGMNDGRIRGVYLVGEDPAHTDPNAHHVDEGFASLEFLVVQDIFLNDTARAHADVVLPAACFAEKEGTFTNTERRVSRVRKAVDPPGDAKPDWEITAALARALGAAWPDYESPEDVWNEFADLAPLWNGIRYDRLEENGLQWPCPDRDHPGTPFLHEDGPTRPGGGLFHAVEYVPPAEQPDAEFPLLLSTGRTLYHYNAATMTRREAGIRQKEDDAFVEMNAADAAALGIADGEPVRVTSRRGTLVAAAAVGDRVRPGTIWMALHFAEAKANWLTNDAVDPRTGTGEYKVCAARLRPLREEESR
jgi:formate dehydrogenase major subunit/formate dehydrogenase alpha subunit